MATLGRHQQHTPDTTPMLGKVSLLTGALLDVAAVGKLLDHGDDLAAMGFIATPVLAATIAVCWHYAGKDTKE